MAKNKMNPNKQKTTSILLTIDVEDWFQVENFKQYIPFSTWSDRELRVEANTHRLLDLFDSIETGGQKSEVRDQRAEAETLNTESSASVIHNRDSEAYSAGLEPLNSEPLGNDFSPPKATFFILGWIAERLPNLVKEIHSRGHEVASHGFSHELCYDCGIEKLKNDLTDSKKLLEDITGSWVYGYRAPSFSINDDILKVIEECGYLYDSSYNSFGLHGRYGKLKLDENSKKGIAYKISNFFYELPVSNLRIGFPFSSNSFVLPWGGGGYFRLFPFTVFKAGLQYILNKEKAYLFYIHPWEVDPGQPRVNASSFFEFRHYINLNKTYPRLIMLIKKFNTCSYITCSQYVKSQV